MCSSFIHKVLVFEGGVLKTSQADKLLKLSKKTVEGSAREIFQRLLLLL